MYGRPFALFNVPGHKNYEMGPSSIQKLMETIARTSILRFCVFRLLESNNLLVGFNVAWVLTTFQLLLPASRLKELGAETSYQLLYQLLAVEGQTFLPELFVLQRIPK